MADERIHQKCFGRWKIGTDQESITVDNIEVDRPIAKGDNYVCEILRVKVTYQRSDNEPKKTSLIVKTPLTGGMHENILEMGLPQKEVNIYNKYLPRMYDIIGATAEITAKSFYSDQENVLVLEDLKFKNYVMADRRLQLDYGHCVLALKSLAMFHAASVKLHNDDPELVEEVGEEVFFSKKVKSSNEEFVKLPFDLMTKECRQVPELNRYYNQLQACSERSWESLIEIMKPKKHEFNVLNHGDFWVNNMLFRYENGNPVSLYLMDFQISRFAPPAVDLHYFLYGSVQEEVRQLRKNDLLTVYLNELNLNLERFGASQRLKESELATMMDAYDLFGLFVSIWLYPIITADPKDGVVELAEMNQEQLKDLNDNPFAHYYKNKEFLERIEKRLGEFEQRGLF